MSAIDELPQFLDEAINKYQIPGATVAVLKDGELVAQAAAGVINLNTAVPTTTDSVFQIGSITKPHTATLIMQLVEEGLVNLDTPVVEYLPEFRVARDDVSRKVTLRQFLSHSSGIDGDFFVDSGRGDDCIQKYIDKCTMLPSLFEPGKMMSYCNVGYAVLGRVIEVMRDQTYDQVLKERIFDPLAMTHALSLPEDSLKFRSAIGHISSKTTKNKTYVTRVPFQPFGQKAQGTTTSMTAADLLRFTYMHINQGMGQTGERVLSSSSVSSMQEQQIRALKHTRDGMTGWGVEKSPFPYPFRRLIMQPDT